MSRDLDSLCDRLRPLAQAFVSELVSKDIPHAVIETRRTPAVQIAYYSQGRDTLENTNTKRHHAGLYPITERDNSRIVTKTLKSKHLTGEAIDIVPLTAHGSIWWSAPKEIWERMGVIGESLGLEWGGRWGAKDGKLGWDCPHYQI